MKRVTQLVSLVVAIFCFSTVNAQIPFKNPAAQRQYDYLQLKKDRLKPLDNSTRAAYSLYIDYSSANGDDLAYVWLFNSLYMSTNGDTGLNYIATTIDNIAGYTDPADITGTVVDYQTVGLWDPYPSDLSITIDSIFEFMTHENNSGGMDYLNTQLVNADATGKPTSTVVWQTTDSTINSLSSGGNWLGTGAGFGLAYAPGYTVPAGTNVACVFNYMDASKVDSLGFDASCVDDGSGGTMQVSSYANSWMRYTPNIPNITHTSNVGYGSPVGSQGWFEAQNWLFTFLVHFDYALGTTDVNDNLSVNTVYPNPANTDANVHYFVNTASNLEVNVMDVTGKIVSNVFSGAVANGHHDLKVNTQNLPSGIYFISMKAGNGNAVVNKLVVAH